MIKKAREKNTFLMEALVDEISSASPALNGIIIRRNYW